MTKTFGAALCAVGVLSGGLLYTQGRSAPDWTTEGADAQRTSWIAADPWLSLDSMPDFKFLWKIKLDNDARQMNALTAPVSMANLNSFRGFKSLVFVGGSANNVYAIDYDFGTLFWKTHFNYSSGVPEYAGSPTCPGGMTSALTRPTNLIAPGQLSFMGFARAPRAAKGEVGQPGKGAPQLTPEPSNGGRGRGAGFGGREARPPAELPAAPPAAPGSATPQPGRGRGPNAIVAVAADGLVRTLNPINGEAVAPPAKLLPPNAGGAGLIQTDGFVYAVSNECGSAPDALWAMDVSRDEKPVVSWKSNGAPIAGPAFGTDGTAYVATGDGTAAYANSIVALRGQTLQVQDWVTVTGGHFNASPVVFTEGSATYVAAAGGNGRLYVLAAEALGGSDHKTPLASAPLPGGGADLRSLTTWRDIRGTRWVLAAARGASDSRGTGAITAFKFNPGGGAPALNPAWVSRDLISPRAPIVVNGVVFALSGGNRSVPAALFALHPDTGKEVWNSGNTITSFATGGLSAGTGQVYVVTYDNTVWAFGIPQAY